MKTLGKLYGFILVDFLGTDTGLVYHISKEQYEVNICHLELVDGILLLLWTFTPAVSAPALCRPRVKGSIDNK